MITQDKGLHSRPLSIDIKVLGLFLCTGLGSSGFDSLALGGLGVNALTNSEGLMFSTWTPKQCPVQEIPKKLADPSTSAKRTSCSEVMPAGVGATSVGSKENISPGVAPGTSTASSTRAKSASRRSEMMAMPMQARSITMTLSGNL